MDQAFAATAQHVPWNKGRLVGQKLPLRLKEIWAIRIRLQLAKRARSWRSSLFNLAIDSKLRGCDLVSLRVCDIAQGNRVSPRAMVLQHKTQRPVQFDLTEQTRDSVGTWVARAQPTLRLGGNYVRSTKSRPPSEASRSLTTVGPSPTLVAPRDGVDVSHAEAADGRTVRHRRTNERRRSCGFCA